MDWQQFMQALLGGQQNKNKFNPMLMAMLGMGGQGGGGFGGTGGQMASGLGGGGRAAGKYDAVATDAEAVDAKAGADMESPMFLK